MLVTGLGLLVANVPTMLHGFPVPVPAAAEIMQAKPDASLDYLQGVLAIAHVVSHLYSGLTCAVIAARDNGKPKQSPEEETG